MNSKSLIHIKRDLWRYIVVCALLLLCAAVTMADPLPVPKFPAGNLLLDSDFESGSAKWTITKISSRAKVKCGATGQASECAFYFKGTSDTSVSTLKQVIKLPATTSKEAVVVKGGYAQRSISGTSCLQKTIKMVFHNPNREPMKKIGVGCGTGVMQGWLTVSNGFSFSDSVTEKSIKKIVVTVKHTGVGEWYFDNPVVMLEAK
jgi:hypothetical protein